MKIRLLAAPLLLGAALAVIPPPAHADDLGYEECGLPAVPATYGSVHHPAETVYVPAVTYAEWRWRREVATLEREHARVVTPAQGTYRWSRPVPGDPSATETADLAPGEQPAGEGWVRGAFAETAPAVRDVVWVAQGATPPPGYDATGVARPGVPVTESAPEPSPLPPAGEGWSVVPGSMVVHEVVPAHDVVVTPAWVEDFVVEPGSPGTEECLEPVEVDDGTPGEVGGVGAVRGHVADATEEGAGAVPEARVLPATGGEVDAWLLALGAGAVLAGGALVRSGRRA